MTVVISNRYRKDNKFNNLNKNPDTQDAQWCQEAVQTRGMMQSVLRKMYLGQKRGTFRPSSF
jgi:hypothetical protein